MLEQHNETRWYSPSECLGRQAWRSKDSLLPLKSRLLPYLSSCRARTSVCSHTPALARCAMLNVHTQLLSALYVVTVTVPPCWSGPKMHR